MKKNHIRILSLLLVMVLSIPGIALAADPYFAGDGTTDSPFLLYDADDLATLSSIIFDAGYPFDATNEVYYYAVAYYKLMDEIDLSEVENWRPIGDTSLKIFKGDFNGNHKTISNLSSVTTTGAVRGLFGWMAGKVYDITLTDVYLQGSPTGTTTGIGGITGVLYSNGIIENCHVTGTLTVGNPGNTNGANFGGIVGNVNGSNARISNCSFDGEIVALYENANFLGGIVGYVSQAGTNLTVENCYSAGIITRPGTGGRNIGKIAGGSGNSTTWNSASFINNTTSMTIDAIGTGGWQGNDGIEVPPPVDPGLKTGLGVRYDDGAVAVKNAERLAVATLWIKADSGTPSFVGMNNFVVLDSAKEGSLYRVTLGYLIAGGQGFTSANAGLLTISGASGVEIIRAKFVSYNDNGNAVNTAYYLEKETGGGIVIPPVDPPIEPATNYDLNGDGAVDQLDLAIALSFYMVNGGEANWDNAKKADFNNDGVVDIEDFIRLLNNMTF